MMPQGSPVNFGNLARAAQAYAYSLQRGGDDAAAQRAALVHVPAAQLQQAIDMGAAAREAARVVGLPASGNEGWFNVQRSLASTPGATTEVYTVAVLRRQQNGTEYWTTIQPQLPRGSSLADVRAEIQEGVDELTTPSGRDSGGSLVRWEAQTVIGHTPGVG